MLFCKSSQNRQPALVAGLAVVLLALNLRASISSASALLDSLSKDLALDPVVVSSVTALPLLAFAVGGVCTARFVARLGLGRTLCLALVTLGVGLALRGVPASWSLVLGTAVGMLGLAVCNVALPAFIRQHFPGRVSFMTSIYTTMMAAGATIAAASSVPLATLLGSSSLGLATWALPAIVAAIAWIPFVAARGTEAATASDAAVKLRDVAKTRFGRLITGYFAVQALNCYVMIGWLPSLLGDSGVSAVSSGLLLAVMQGVGIPTTFIVLALTSTPERTRLAFLVVSVSMIAGFTGLLVAPASGTVVWVTLVGVGLCSFPLILATISRSGTTAAEVTAVSALAQSVGYLVAAVGSTLFGLLGTLTGGWVLPMGVLLLFAMLQLVLGLAFTKRTSTSVES